MKSPLPILVLVLMSPLSLYAAESPVLEAYRIAAKQETPAFNGFSAARGEGFYRAKSGDLACVSCHGASPKDHGKHATTGNDILPMATVANPQRFTDAAKVEKWFRRNCNDVLKRACTASEKGDFITYLSSVK